MDNQTLPQLITVADAADRLGLSRSKCYELMAAGELPSVRIGHNRRIDIHDLQRFVDSRRTTNTKRPSQPSNSARTPRPLEDPHGTEEH